MIQYPDLHFQALDAPLNDEQLEFMQRRARRVESSWHQGLLRAVPKSRRLHEGTGAKGLAATVGDHEDVDIREPALPRRLQHEESNAVH
ncbi:MAG: hypothetical protein HYV60_21970 [Planctomycetia bacterium]|nr:hypothetical protein [Planctomycetia bacterium]